MTKVMSCIHLVSFRFFFSPELQLRFMAKIFFSRSVSASKEGPIFRAEMKKEFEAVGIMGGGEIQFPREALEA